MEVRIKRADRQRDLEAPAAHARLWWDGKVGLTLDADFIIVMPIYHKRERYGILRRHIVHGMVSAECKYLVALVRITCTELAVYREAAS
jgi:hypothetical protein